MVFNTTKEGQYRCTAGISSGSFSKVRWVSACTKTKQTKTKNFHCRYGHSAVAYKQKVYMWGGRNDEMCCSILFCFDTITHQWTKPEVNGEIPAVRDGRKIVTFVSQIRKFTGLSLQVIPPVLSTTKCTYSEVSKNKPIGSHATFIVWIWKRWLGVMWVHRIEKGVKLHPPP